jgi:hypothetical protein
VIAGPITWSAGLMARHIVVYNALFASIQLLLAVGLLYRPTAKAALAASIPWALGVWWIGEGLGGLPAGAGNPLTGAPGAAALYVFLALLAWPVTGGGEGLAAGDAEAVEGVDEDPALGLAELARASRACMSRQNEHPLSIDARILTSSISRWSRPASAAAFSAIVCSPSSCLQSSPAELNARGH